MKRLVAILALVIPTLSHADGVCPAAPDHAEAIANLIEDVNAAKSPAEAQAINAAMWELWTDAPDNSAQELLDSGMSRRSSYDFVGALEDLDRLVAYCPDYAEGYNQRAFVNFLRGNFAGALPDLDRAIELSPTHVGAISGRALTLMGLGRDAEAQDTLARAVELNPWLPERDLLRPPASSAPAGEDL